jgi:DNA N-6-adenine-methyltransferase Dam
MSNETSLVRYDAACRAVAEAKTVDEAKSIRDKAVAMQAYARQAKNRDLEADALEIRMRATRRLDQLRQAQKGTVGLSVGTRGSRVKGARVDEKPTLASQGIDKNLAHNARKLGALSEEDFERAVSEGRSALINRAQAILDGKARPANYSSGSNEWYTPSQYTDAVRELFGRIDLDPASNEKANAWIKAKQVYTAADDGLARPWRGRVFVNPPYGIENGKSVAGAWCQRAIEQYESGAVEACVILVNSVHDQSWQEPLFAFPVCLVDHRIKFLAGDGTENENPTNRNLFVYLGNDRAKFADVFSRFGWCCRRENEARRRQHAGAGRCAEQRNAEDDADDNNEEDFAMIEDFEMTKEQREEWLMIRREAAAKIDPEMADVFWEYGSILDPYYLFERGDDWEDCIGRNYFARSPESDVWVFFGDLPAAVCNRLWERISAGDFDRE